jgi:hypothetical protein
VVQDPLTEDVSGLAWQLTFLGRNAAASRRAVRRGICTGTRDGYLAACQWAEAWPQTVTNIDFTVRGLPDGSCCRQCLTQAVAWTIQNVTSSVEHHAHGQADSLASAAALTLQACGELLDEHDPLRILAEREISRALTAALQEGAP